MRVINYLAAAVLEVTQCHAYDKADVEHHTAANNSVKFHWLQLLQRHNVKQWVISARTNS